jgi:hypothetical protein
MKGHSPTHKASFKVSMPKHQSHTDKGPAVPVEYAKNISVLNRASSRAMRVASRRGR